MKVKTLTPAEAAKIIADNPQRTVGQYAKVCEEVIKLGQPKLISGLSRGQCWNVKKLALSKGLSAQVVNKSSAVLIQPAVKK